MKCSAQCLEFIKDLFNVSYYYYYYYKLNKALFVPAQGLEDPSLQTSRETKRNKGVSLVQSTRHVQRVQKFHSAEEATPGQTGLGPRQRLFIFIIISCLFTTGSGFTANLVIASYVVSIQGGRNIKMQLK